MSLHARLHSALLLVASFVLAGLAPVALGAGPPDVSIAESDIGFSNDHPQAFENITITATVHNIGGLLSGPVTVRFFQDQDLVFFSEKTIANIESNQTGQVSTTWYAQLPRTYSIKVRVECSGDASATNNDASRSITVGSSGGALVVEATLEPTSCKPKQAFFVNGTVRQAGQPRPDAAVTVTVKPSGPAATATTGASGQFSVNLTAPEKAGRYEVEAAATYQSFKGNDTVTLEVVMPDLTVTDLTFSNDAPKEGESIVLTASVRNNGTEAVENFTVAFFRGSAKLKTVSAGPAAPKATVAVVLSWKAVKGTSAMKAAADPDGKLVESDETNNVFERSLSIKGGGGKGGLDATLLVTILVSAVVVVAAVAVAAFLLWRR